MIDGHGHPPLEVSSDAPRFESVPQPAICDGDGVGAPATAHLALADVILKTPADLREVEEHVLGDGRAGRAAAQLGSRVLELHGVEERAAGVALVPARVLVPAFGASALDETVSQELFCNLVVQLLHAVLVQQLLVHQGVEYALRDGGLLGGGGAAELVELDVEPLIDALVDLVVLVANLPRRQALLQSLGLRSSAVLVRAANVNHVVPAAATVASVHVRAQHASNDVAEMGHVVHIRQRAGHQDISLPRLGHHARRARAEEGSGGGSLSDGLGSSSVQRCCHALHKGLLTSQMVEPAY
mmetsp:Transcript_35423/g.67798  ORF Transcript_35423/g.67798 Transcript_35423/m.67798 type:complete len:299 (+) Transcript_35423:1976-2872(+)